jgi:glutamate decarboxylase
LGGATATTPGEPIVTLKHPHAPAESKRDLSVAPLFTLESRSIPRHELPEGQLPPDVAYQVVHDELMLDGNARLNVATFVTTWMEPPAVQLMAECFDKNMIDKDEYPQTAELEMRCVSILSRLWHAPDAETATGCSTTGSSEAAMLGGLALKRRWQQRRKAEGKPADRPNLVMGINVQICWEKFANYWDVEMRLVPMAGDRFHLSAEEAVALCDENTIGVVAILGSTFDGSYEPVQEICGALDAFQRETGIDVPVHVDGASGAFVAPFVDPELAWDFSLPRVASINASGHKYGLVYPGVGWIVWRDAESLPEDLIFWVNYLGDNMPTFALNFSRPGAQIVAQYYNFLRLGFDGYRQVQAYARDVATRLSAQIAELGPFELITSGDELPVFAFRLRGEIDNYTVFDVSNALRERGWQVPAYTFPKNREDLAALRVVVRRGFTHDLADLLVADLKRQLPRLQSQPQPVHDSTTASSFHH